jgi:hypothetical protein
MPDDPAHVLQLHMQVGKAVEKQRRKATGLKRNAMIAELPEEQNLAP